MSFLWSKIDASEKTDIAKYRISRISLSLLAAACGLLVWLLLPAASVGAVSLICLTGYPLVIAWVTAYVYGCNHPFHSGRFQENANGYVLKREISPSRRVFK